MEMMTNQNDEGRNEKDELNRRKMMFIIFLIIF